MFPCNVHDVKIYKEKKPWWNRVSLNICVWINASTHIRPGVCGHARCWFWVLQAAVKSLPLFPLSDALEISSWRHLNFLLLNCLWAPCPLMEASSHGKEGNQINCMSVNRITSSLTCRESGLKLITHAWRDGRMGRSKGGGEQWGRTRHSQGFSSQ